MVDADAIFDSFFAEVIEPRGVALYPAQEEAILEIFAGQHVILNTPTGSGKSLVAMAMHHRGLAEGRRSFYTSPIKALVSEKFFDLCRQFGAARVGMLTGDASINRDAPIVCCTAEILANLALSEGESAAVDYVIMDEFHYYADRDRGVAWQLPLLCLPQATFLLMSATLGDLSTVSAGIEQLTGRPVALVRSHERPVPLDYSYLETPLHETLTDLLQRGRSPLYVVNFTQRECVEQAQATMSQDFCSKEEKQAIVAAMGHFRFDTPFGKEMKRFLRHGLGLHHAGLLPKYRLLVEKLAQAGLLKVIMGTDTLGVGINVPIRTVVFTRLCKFDGERTAVLSVRDFKQIAGRAGRKGFDDAGSVVVQAPEHVIENKRMESRAAASGKKKNKLVRKKPPTRNYAPYDAGTLARLSQGEPEPLTSVFTLSFGMVLTVLQSARGPQAGMRYLVQRIALCHDSGAAKSRHRRHLRQLFITLRQAGVIALVKNRQSGPRVVVDVDLQKDFALHRALGLYVLATLPQLPDDSPTWGLDVVSLVESILEQPLVILNRQVDRARGERIVELKAAGMDYEDRLVELDKVTYPKPLADFIYLSYNAYAARHPWVSEHPIYPKSIVREMLESCASFAEYVRTYGLERSEGVLLRYLSQAYKVLKQTVPELLRDEVLEDAIASLHGLLGRVDGSLVEAWETLLAPAAAGAAIGLGTATAPVPLSGRALRARLRSEMHALLGALARRDWEEAAALLRQDGPVAADAAALEAAMGLYFASYSSLRVTPDSRRPEHTLLRELGPQHWSVAQVLCDPDGDNLWAVHAEVDLNQVMSGATAKPEPEPEAWLTLMRIGP